jgi:hypothetical protein
MSTDHHAANPTDRIETAPIEYYLPATPSETLVTAVNRLSSFLKRDA